MMLPLLAAAFVPTAQVLDSPADAWPHLLTSQPQVIAFGEYHQTQKTTGIPSALKRFTEDMLAGMRLSTSDLVLETWLSEGNCGKKEEQVVKDVQKTTERPAATEDEIVTLARLAKGMRIQPHALTLSCADYDSLQGKDGQVDFEVGLRLIGDKLAGKIREVLAEKRRPGALRRVVVYGGALHNDLFPREEMAKFTFGQAIQKETAGKYLEVDLYVPEFVENDEKELKEPWYALYKRHERPGKSVLIARGENSYILVFPRTSKAGKPKAGKPKPK